MEKEKEKNEAFPELSVESENVAVPEVQTGLVEDEITKPNPPSDTPKKEEDMTLVYDNLAIPEIVFEEK